ncbi:hypothetical protein FD06_GL000980 [Apilactobacillus ozensis DSM 23829 = JCM 17196]|uniref:Uncharacterized protein n=1 Tax=Apilactobacillus ozensis DSM 23829 = JCM 17196 TaxID=1423781 RepID=A0A0R2APQ8_9LACO|nr:UPF0223 family protein [Apilactobacillus ozensis]KRM68661.1 hypothetical protein FD06_GL000980 [Apilactobacillus ozensis DSM 23829 = JCM 17196]
MKNYSYPIIEDWSQNELVQMIKLFNLTEDAYENGNGTNVSDFINQYNLFRKINPSKMEQKQICKDFYDKSSYDIFKVYKLASKSSKKRLKMN